MGMLGNVFTSGLQIRVGRFDSGPRLHNFLKEINALAGRLARAFLFWQSVKLPLQTFYRLRCKGYWTGMSHRMPL